MPSFPRSRSRNEADEKSRMEGGKTDEKNKASSETSSQTAAEQSHGGETLPAYSAIAPPSQAAEATVDQLAAELVKLQLAQVSGFPDAHTCLAHLRFLSALHTLKEDVGYTDGVFGIWDARALGDFKVMLPEGKKLPTTPQEEEKARLGILREKRWTLFVARAVERYTVWWNTFPKTMLEEDDMLYLGNKKYVEFPSSSDPMQWTPDMLPPLDVMMVLHAHMLNPRDFLEDTMRVGFGGLRAAGFPWAVVNEAITPDFGYVVPEATKSAWVERTGLNWENVDDKMTKEMKCPACRKVITVPWTTCSTEPGKADSSDSTTDDELTGFGYGDGNFNVDCDVCGVTITPQLLSLAKFIGDVRELMLNQRPMPGTLLTPSTGCPEVVTNPVSRDARTFPNRLVRVELASWTLELIQPGQAAGNKKNSTMEVVRDEIEIVLNDSKRLRAVNQDPILTRVRLPRDSRVATRRMMSRYWDNFSPFALDLSGAVQRQGVFADKMHQIDWLHSPAAAETMRRLLVKYERFVGLMAENPDQTCVPTLDIDLAWHTHQLSPQDYFCWTVQTTKTGNPANPAQAGKFIDHDDKIDEDRLNLAFEFTSKVYQQKYEEVYSECTCWYCEAVRATHVSTAGKLLGLSKNDRIAEDFYKSGQAQLCPPDKAAHISAHNAVSFALSTSVARRAHERQMQRLEENYNKAAKRAAKRGRKLPPRDEYYDHWGYAYFMYSPFMYTGYYSPGLYYGADPGCVPNGSGTWGSCASGSCASGVGAGACGGPGGCGSCGGAAGACSGGAAGGGCGGGGGGGCGGGGGGGCGGGGC